MDIDINNLRIRLAKNTDLLIKRLNSHIADDNRVDIPVEDIDRLIHDIRCSVWTLCCVYDDSKDGEFRCVFEDVGDIDDFNPEKD